MRWVAMAHSSRYGEAEEFVDELLDRLERRGFMTRHADGTVQLTRGAVEKLGYRPGEHLERSLGRLAAMVELEEPR